MQWSKQVKKKKDYNDEVEKNKINSSAPDQTLKAIKF